MALGNKLNCGLYIGFCVIKHEKSTSQHDSHVISFDKSWCLKVMSWSIPEKSTNVQNSIRIEQLHCVLDINLIANGFLNSFVLITEVVQGWILIHEITWTTINGLKGNCGTEHFLSWSSCCILKMGLIFVVCELIFRKFAQINYCYFFRWIQ